jgi:hypothetical protein
MQITSQEDFLLLGSSSIFKALESVDILNTIWQIAIDHEGFPTA